jgi:hypothetical protein
MEEIGMGYTEARMLHELPATSARLATAARRALVTAAVAAFIGAGAAPLAHAEGNVTVKLNDKGKIKITGDAESNRVDIRPGTAPNTVEVSALDDDTTINGATGPLVLTGATGLSADLDKGDDTLEVRDLTFADKVKVDVGNGTNSVLLETVTAQKKVSLSGGKGGDSITVRQNSSFASNLGVSTGGGPDSITINNVFCGSDLNITTSGGNDFVQISLVTFESDGDLEIETEGGNDTLDLFNDNFEGEVDADLGDNDDDMIVEDCDFDEKVEINGGGGDDEADNGGGNTFDLGEVIRIKGFEDID